MPGYIEPTATQRKVLAYVAERIRVQGRSPTYKEITDHFGWKSTNAARGHVRLLIRKGLLRRDEGLARGVGLPGGAPQAAGWKEVPIVGGVAAGRPTEAIEYHEGMVGVDAGLFPEDGVFALRVKGSSMVGAGIHEGDLAVVREGVEAGNGDIVVAVVDGEATVKRYFHQRGKVVLHAENPEFADLEVSSDADFSIFGVVVGIVRRL